MIALCHTTIALGQEQDEHAKEHPANYPKNIVGLGVGAMFVPQGEKVEGDNAVGAAIEAYYVRKFPKRWGGVLIAEWELKEYEVKFEGEPIRRNNILIISALEAYKLTPDLKVALGSVYEFT